MLLVISAALCGTYGWNDMERFGHNQLDWLRKFGYFAHGEASRGAINQIFGTINQNEFDLCFSYLAQGITLGQVCVSEKSNGVTAIPSVSINLSVRTVRPIFGMVG